jgi:glycine cleavage system aminomethyltransferase T
MPAVLQTDMTSAYAAFWLFGPHTDEALRQVTHHDVAAMSPGSCAETGLAGVPAILIHPLMPAIASMRILTAWDVAEYVWEKIWQVGQTWKISALGMDGLDLLLNQTPK